MIAALLLLSTAGSGALAAMTREDAPAQTPDRPWSVPEPVIVAEALPAPSAGEEFSGVILARASVDVVAPAEGQIRAVGVRVGDRVPAGGRIARLDQLDARFELQRAEASARAAQVEPDPTQIDLAEAEIRAPFEGIVAGWYAPSGARVKRGEPIARLIAASDRLVRFAAPEERAAEIEVGLRVRVAVGSVELMGRVEKVVPEIDTASRRVFVEAALEQVASALDAVLLGEVARVSLPAPAPR
jgi:membrane fusion protein, multidrug efflux system